jgi:hypothetical protein
VARAVPAAGVRAHGGGRPVSAPDERAASPRPPKDDGLRRVLTWTLVALVVTVVMAAVGAALMIRWFDTA